jgi:hypothetical protein
MTKYDAIVMNMAIEAVLYTRWEGGRRKQGRRMTRRGKHGEVVWSDLLIADLM